MHVRRALALTAVVPLLLAGCSDDPEPQPKMPDPPPSSSPTPTASETVEAESAEEFIRRWVEAGDEMQVTGDTAEYDSMTPRCKPCQDFVANVEEVYRDGGSAQFGGSKIVSLDRVAADPPTYDLTKDLPETTIEPASGEPEVLPGGRTSIRVTLGKSKGQWVVTHFGIL